MPVYHTHSYFSFTYIVLRPEHKNKFLIVTAKVPFILTVLRCLLALPLQQAAKKQSHQQALHLTDHFQTEGCSNSIDFSTLQRLVLRGLFSRDRLLLYTHTHFFLRPSLAQRERERANGANNQGAKADPTDKRRRKLKRILNGKGLVLSYQCGINHKDPPPLSHPPPHSRRTQKKRPRVTKVYPLSSHILIYPSFD